MSVAIHLFLAAIAHVPWWGWLVLWVAAAIPDMVNDRLWRPGDPIDHDNNDDF